MAIRGSGEFPASEGGASRRRVEQEWLDLTVQPSSGRLGGTMKIKVAGSQFENRKLLYFLQISTESIPSSDPSAALRSRISIHALVPGET